MPLRAAPLNASSFRGFGLWFKTSSQSSRGPICPSLSLAARSRIVLALIASDRQAPSGSKILRGSSLPNNRRQPLLVRHWHRMLANLQHPEASRVRTNLFVRGIRQRGEPLQYLRNYTTSLQGTIKARPDKLVAIDFDPWRQKQFAQFNRPVKAVFHAREPGDFPSRQILSA